MEDQEEKYKIIVMAILLGICCFLTYYFHLVVSTGVVFTHFFYIPIILAAMWWKRKGLAVALFLTSLLIFSHFIIRTDVVAANDLIRAPMFIVVALVTVFLGERIEKAQEEAKKRKNIIATIPDSLLVIDKDLMIKNANLSFYKVFPMEPEKAIGCRITDILGDKGGILSTELTKLFGTKTEINNLELPHHSEKLGDRIFNIAAKGIIVASEEEEEEEVLVVIEDITERKHAEEQIKASLKEKEVLLREIHHRVKNNLQLISSMLMLQSEYIRDKQVSEMFKQSLNRIKAMAIIHDRLYRSKDLASIDFKDYICDQVNSLFSLYELDRNKIALTIDVKDVLLGVDAAIPCGLIINELVSNSMKHAFPDGREGKIGIALRLTSENEIELVVGDNGVGMQADLDFRNTESLGLYLVTILAEDQLHGKIELDRTKGTKFHITFREEVR